MRSKSIALCLFSIFALIGCAHSAMRGSVAMKTSETEGHVCLGKGEVDVGDKVSLYRNDCPNQGGKKVGGNICKKVKLGEGKVTEIINDHYSVATFPSGLQFDEGTVVEKIR